MFDKEDIECIVSAMYKDELRNISEKMKFREFNLAGAVRLNSNLKRYLGKIRLIWEKLSSIFIRSNIVNRGTPSKVIDSLYEKEKQYKFELKELNLKKNEIECSYQYMIANINKGDIKYVENLILMRSINANPACTSNKSKILQYLTE